MGIAVLARLIKLRPGEARLVVLLGLFAFAATAAAVTAQAVGFGLFLATFGSRDLPFAYMTTAVAAAFFAFAYLRLAGRLSLERLLALDVGFVAAGSLAFRLGLLSSHPRWLLFILPTWYQIVINLAYLAIWALAGRVLDVQEGKRLFGLINAGYWLAWVIGGTLVPSLVSWFGIDNLLLFAAAAAFAALSVERLIVRLYGKRVTAPAERAKHGGQVKQDPAEGRYVHLIFTLTFCLWLGFFIVDNIFLSRTAIQFPRAAALAGVLGVLAAAEGILALLVTTFLTARILARFGIRAALVAMPTLVATAVAGIIVVGSLRGPGTALFSLAATAKLLNVALSFSIQVTALVILYQPLSGLRRVQVQTIAEGIVQPIAIGFAGLFLLILRTAFKADAVFLSFVFLLLVAVWVPVIVLVTRQYPPALARALSRRRLADRPPLGKESIPVLQRELESPYPEVALYALRLLDQTPEATMASVLPRAVEHPSPGVRREALRRIERLRLRQLSSLVERRLREDPDPTVRGASVLALAALDGTRQEQRLLPYIRQPDIEVRRGAMVGLARYGGEEGMAAVTEEVERLAASTESSLRALAAGVLRDAAIGAAPEQLRALLHDDAPAVRREALGAMGRRGQGELWSAVVGALDDPGTRAAAADALITHGREALPAIRAALGQPAGNRSVLRLIRICGRIGGEQAAEILQDFITAPNAEIRTRALRNMTECGFAAGESAPVVRRQIESEVYLARWSMQARADIAGNEVFSLLGAGLEEMARGGVERLLYLLSFLFDASALLRAHEALLSGDERRRAYALELLETLLPDDLRAHILPLLQALTGGSRQRGRERVAPVALSPEERLQAILDDVRGEHEPWVLTCALYTAGCLGLDRYRLAVRRTVEAADPLVRETARWSLVRLELGSQAIPSNAAPEPGGQTAMLSTVEKAIILKATRLFGDTPDAILAEVGTVAEEVELSAGTALFHKGDVGDSMYVIVSGALRVHDGDSTLNELGRHDVLGEMTLLDREPRSASVTAMEDSLLLRIDHEPFLELMADRIEVVRGIVRAVAGHLRASSREVARLSARVKELEAAAAGR